MSLYAIFLANPGFYYIVVGMTSLLIGSFLNVVIYRLPIMMEREWRAECNRFLNIENESMNAEAFNLMVPRSKCPKCDHKISAFENIPLLSFLILGGKCRGCKSAISIRYPIIELTTCILSVIAAMHFGPGVQSLFAVVMTWTLIVLTMIDFDHQLLPDSITLPFLWLGIICNMFGLYTDIHSSLIGAIAGYMILWSVYMAFKLVTGKEGMGFGDFKLLAMLGAWLGWQVLPLIIILSSVLGSLVGIGLIVFSGHQKNKPIPFGPYLATAGWIALMFGDQLTRMYLNLMIS